MTRSSRSRRLRARGKRRALKAATSVTNGVSNTEAPGLPKLSKEDKFYLSGFAVIALVITIFYWSLGGRNLFVFPAVFCLSVALRNFLSEPKARFADDV